MILVKRLAAILFLIVATPYLLVPVYQFPAARPFAGPRFWNPYAQLNGSWQRANLHAHGRSWMGLTNGSQSDVAVVEAYRQQGYDVAGISDYQRIAAHHGVPTLPLYEHGYNLAKAHQLAIGAQQVEWFDIPLWQGRNEKQFILDRVNRTADLVAINHPASAYTEDDLRHLTSYQLFELINGPFTCEGLWDAALSSGHPVWAIADDDNHDVTDVRRMGVAWSMIDAPSPDMANIVTALREGRSYAVSVFNGKADATLMNVTVDGAVLTVVSSGVPATFLFIGQNGVVRRTADQVNRATYTIAANDPYIRTVIRTPNMVIYVNPIIRYDGVHLQTPVATLDAFRTWLRRAAVALAWLTVLVVLWRRDRVRQRPRCDR